MTHTTAPIPELPVSLPATGGKRLLTGIGRSLRRRCPYCGGSHIFQGWFTLLRDCPHCHTRYAIEDGYLLGSYVINIGVTELFTVAVVIWMLVSANMSVLAIQIAGASLAIALPIAFYPYAVLLWIALDIAIHDPTSPTHPRQLHPR